MRKTGFMLLSVLGVAALAYADANVVAPFLQNGLGGRASGMADCYSAVAEGPFGAWYNPAGVAQTRSAEVGAQVEAWGAESTHNTLAGVYPVGAGALSGVINSYSYGTLGMRDENGTATGDSLSLSDTLLSLGYALPLAAGWSAGANVGMYQCNLGTTHWSGVAADVGALWSVGQVWSLGAVVKNLGTGYDGFSLPTSARLAAAFLGWNRHVLVDAEVEYPIAQTYPEIGLGVEFVPWDWLGLRLGYKGPMAQEPEAGQNNLVAGLGFSLGNWGVDLNCMLRGNFGIRTGLSLEYAFGQSYRGLIQQPIPSQPEKNSIPEAQKREKPSGTSAVQTKGQEDLRAQAESHYQAAQDCQNDGRYLDALLEYKAALKLRPDYPEAQAGMALAMQKAETAAGHQAVDKPNEDSSILQRSIRKHYEKGLTAYKTRNFNTSIKELQLVLELTTKHQEATALLQKAEEALHNELAILHQQAASAAKRGDLATEIAAYQKMLELAPDNAKVEAKLKAAQQEIPQRAEEMYRNGVDHYAKMQYHEALKIFEALLRLQPNHVKAGDAVKKIKEKMLQTGQ